MNNQVSIFKFIDYLSSNYCKLGDSIYMPKGIWLNLKDMQLSNLPVTFFKKFYNEKFSFVFNFVGNLLIKIGVSCRDKSFIWCGENIIKSSTISKGSCDVDLANISSGNIEITFYSIEESCLFDNVRQQAKEISVIPDQVLYTFISPSYDLCCEEPLYYNFYGTHCWYSFQEQLVHLKNNASVDLLTYFNSFSAAKWQVFTNVDNLALYVDFKGTALAELIHLTEFGKTVFASWSLNSPSRATLKLPFGKYPDTGILGLRIHAHGDCLLYGGGYLSDSPEIQPVHLGIGITTYHREGAVKHAVSRLGKAIAEHPLYRHSIDITVVDNGRTLSAADVPKATLIHNRNLGGTGGFTRSLIHYQETGRHTHCLFMDDDAICEVGSIFRSMSFIRHAKDGKTALAGAMLYKDIQFLQWEKGAWFNGGCKSVNRDLDLRIASNLLVDETQSHRHIYGAWWFFFFPLSAVRHYALPFFVRGDDIDFSYVNDFRIMTLNGVSCWQQDFITKENALNIYLFIRSHIVHHLTIPQLKCSFKTVWKMLWEHLAKYNNSYLYGSAACVNLAMKHVLQGPVFWEKNMEPDIFMEQVNKFSSWEEAKPYTENEIDNFVFADNNIKTRLFPVFLRKASLNGHLLPGCMIRHTPEDMLYKRMMPKRNRVYMRDQIIIIDEYSRKKTVLTRSTRRYLGNLLTFTGLSLIMGFRYHFLQKKYAKMANLQRTRDFWKKQFGDQDGQ